MYRSILLRCALVLAAIVPFTQTAVAQGQELSGQWYCEWATSKIVQGQLQNSVTGQVNIMLHPNGFAEGQGWDNAVQSNMSVQAQWSVQKGQLLVRGQMVHANGWPSTPGNFNLVSNIISANNLALTQQLQGGVYASQCQRAG